MTNPNLSPENLDAVMRAVYDEQPWTVISEAMAKATGLPLRAVIPYDLFKATGGDDSPLRRTVSVAIAAYRAALSQTLPAPGEETCPVCEGKPMPLGSGCMAGCRDGIVLTTSANVLRNMLFWFRIQEREIAELRMTPARQEAIRQAARAAVGDNTSLHPWHVIDETILAMSSSGSSATPEKPLATVAAANDEGVVRGIEAAAKVADAYLATEADGDHQKHGRTIAAAIRLLSQGGGK